MGHQAERLARCIVIELTHQTYKLIVIYDCMFTQALEQVSPCALCMYKVFVDLPWRKDLFSVF